jgi:hypothetical protein
MLNTIISLAILGFGLNYYFKYQNLKKQMNTPSTTPTGDEPNDVSQPTSVPEKQIGDQ